MGQGSTGSAQFDLQIFKRTSELVRKELEIFEKRHPEINVRIHYIAPYFVLRVGDCGDEQDALKLKEELKNEYPGSEITNCTNEK